MPVLSMMMRMAELWGYRLHNSNPCKNTKRCRMESKARFLTAEEMARLNAVLTRDEFYCPQAVAVIRLLMLTGCRFGEIVSLEWDWIKGKRIHLPDSKSGPRTAWLSSAAGAVIDAIPKYSPDCPFLFPARPPTRHLDNFEYQWHRIRNEAGLPGLRIHDLRHNWASVVAMNGVDMVTIAKLLGHALVETTAGYAHLADAHLVEAATHVGGIIATAMRGSTSPQPDGNPKDGCNSARSQWTVNHCRAEVRTDWPVLATCVSSTRPCLPVVACSFRHSSLPSGKVGNSLRINVYHCPSRRIGETC